MVALASDALARGIDQTMVRARVEEELGWARAAQGDLAAAIDALVSRVTGVPEARHDLLRGYVAMIRADWDGADQLFSRASRILDVQEDLSLRARARRFAGTLLERRGSTDEAFPVLDEARALAAASGDAEEVFSCLVTLSLAATEARRWDIAIDSARESMTLSDRMRYTFGRAISRNNLAWALCQHGPSSEAIDLAEQALTLARLGGLEGLEAAFLATRGSARLAVGDVEGARADAEASLVIGRGTEDEEPARELLDLVEAAALREPAHPPAKHE